MQVLPFTIFGPSVKAGVLKVQKDVLEELPFPVQWLNQVHGVKVLEVEKISGPEEADAMISTTRGVPLLIKTADCIPLVMADEKAGLVAAVHAGWRGLTADIVPLVISRMIALGASVDRLKVGVGPSLGVECAEFSEPEKEIPEKYHWAVREDRHVDLWRILEHQLREAGVTEDRVEWMRVCTCCSSEWFSWRRDKVMHRFGTFIELL
jgi:YfiH family protein